MKRAVLAVALLGGLAAPARADDEHLDLAQRAIDDIDYEAARGHVGRALDGGGLALADHLRARRIAGEVEAALGDAEAAREHFRILVLLDPDARLADGLSPKITEPFDQARAAGGRFEVDVELERGDGGILVTLDTSDPLSLIARFEARGGGAEVAGAERTATLATGEPGGFEVTVTVFDARGNQLAVVTASAPPAAAAEPADSGESARGGWPAIVRWPTWTALAVVAAGTGGYFSYRVGQAEDDLETLNADPGAHTADEARALQERGERDATLANVFYGVAGLAAIAAVATFVLEPDDDVEVRPAAGIDGAGVTAIVRF